MMTVGKVLLWMDLILVCFVYAGLRTGSHLFLWWVLGEGLLGLDPQLALSGATCISFYDISEAFLSSHSGQMLRTDKSPVAGDTRLVTIPTLFVIY